MAYNAPRASGLLLGFALLAACAGGADESASSISGFASSVPLITDPASTGLDTQTTGARPTTTDDGTTGREPPTTLTTLETGDPTGTTIGTTTDDLTTDTADTTDSSSSGEPVLCGNGAIDLPEECDGANLNAMDCTTFGFTGGALTCTPQCTFEKAQCTSPSCGDGTVDLGEECDCGQQGANCTAAQLGDTICSALPSPGGGNYSAGTLACNSPGSCSFNKAACTYCGDGVRNGPESCDGPDLAGQTCQTQGFVAGTLTCSACAFNTLGCSKCGNGAIDPGELCDGGNFNGQTCASVDPNKFASGALSCSVACNTLLTNACNAGNCCAPGNGPGTCSVNAIRACVCNVDPYCCSNIWDSYCAQEAVDPCGAQC